MPDWMLGPSTPQLAAILAAYQGPGDIAPGAFGFYSPARAYSAAFAAGGTAIMDILDTSGANAATINILSTGFVDLNTLNAWIVAHGSAVVTKLYDQTGNGNHIINVTLAQMPALTTSSINGLPGVTFTNAAGSRLISAGTISQGQPVSFACVAKQTTGNTGGIIGSNSNPPGLIGGLTNTFGITGNGTNVVTQAAAANAFHAAQALLSGTVNSFISVDGTASAPGNASTTTYVAANISMGRGNGTSIIGTIMEGIIWGSDQSANFAAINTNQHSVPFGYNF